MEVFKNNAIIIIFVQILNGLEHPKMQIVENSPNLLSFYYLFTYLP